MSVNTTIGVYFDLIKKYHHDLSKSDNPELNSFYLDRIEFYIKGINGIYSLMSEPNQYDKNYVSAAKLMHKQAKEKLRF